MKVNKFNLLSKLPRWFLAVLFMITTTAAIFSQTLFVRPGNPCPGETAKSACWENLVRSTYQNSGLRPSFQLLSQQSQEDPNFAKDCEHLARIIGEEVLTDFSKDDSLNSPLGEYIGWCNFGLFKGFAIKLFEKDSDPLIGKKFCSFINENAANLAPSAIGSCYVTLSRMFANHIGEPEDFQNQKSILNLANKVCGIISPEAESSSQMTEYCYDGATRSVVDMYVVVNPKTHPGFDPTFLSNTPFKFCVGEKAIFLKACYKVFSELLSWYNQGDLEVAGKFIEKINDDVYAEVAMRALSFYQGMLFREYNLSFPKIISSCQKLQSRLKTPCINGVIPGLMNNGIPGKEHLTVESYCSSETLAKEERDNCFNEFVKYIQGIYGREKYLKICKDLKESYQHLCTELSTR